MKIWSIIAFDRVVACFVTKEDAEQVCYYLKTIIKFPCRVVEDTKSTGPEHQHLFKTGASQSLIQLLDLIRDQKAF